MSQPGKHISWKPEHRHAVAKRAVELLREGGYTKMDALFQAQIDVFADQGMRKKMFGASLRQDLYNRIDMLGSMPVAAPAPAPVAPPPPPPLVIPENLLEFVGKLGAEFAKGFLAEVTPALQAFKLVQPPAPAPAVVVPEKTNGGNGGHEHGNLPVKFHKTKICVIGMPERFRFSIQQRFPHLDFRWLDGSAPGHVIGTTSSNCAHTYYMVKGASHKSARGIKGPHTDINGAMSELCRVMTHKFPRVLDMDRKPEERPGA